MGCFQLNLVGPAPAWGWSLAGSWMEALPGHQQQLFFLLSFQREVWWLWQFVRAAKGWGKEGLLVLKE